VGKSPADRVHASIVGCNWQQGSDGVVIINNRASELGIPLEDFRFQENKKRGEEGRNRERERDKYLKLFSWQASLNSTMKAVSE